MDKKESIEFCVNLVRDFISDYCDGELNLLCEIDLEKIDGTSKYGKPVEYFKAG